MQITFTELVDVITSQSPGIRVLVWVGIVVTAIVVCAVSFCFLMVPRPGRPVSEIAGDVPHQLPATSEPAAPLKPPTPAPPGIAHHPGPFALEQHMGVGCRCIICGVGIHYNDEEAR